MTTTIRGKSGKSALRELLDQHDECLFLVESASSYGGPFKIALSNGVDTQLSITSLELQNILNDRLQVINTKLENLGLKIGDEVENAQ